jgi:hypothetical protein
MAALLLFTTLKIYYKKTMAVTGWRDFFADN